MSTTYLGMNARTGQALTDEEHIRQSVNDIITTPQGTRLTRRSYGSQVPYLIDAPLNSVTRMRVMSATVLALAQWEPRLELTAVALNVGTGAQTGGLTIAIQSNRRDANGEALSPSTLLMGAT